MGESQDPLIPLDFNRSIRIEGRPEKLTGDAGVSALRPIDHQLGITAWLADHLIDPRNQDLITHPFVERLRSRLYLRAQGWRDADDADALRPDPALRLGVSERRGIAPLQDPDPDEPKNVPHGLASQPTLSRLTSTRAIEAHRGTMRQGLMLRAKRHVEAARGPRVRYATLDLDSTNRTVHGHQPGSAYNGYYKEVCAHPIGAMFAPPGDWIDVALREGHVHTAEGAADFLFQAIEAAEGELCQISDVRGDAGMPDEKLLGGLEPRRVGSVFRLKDHDVLSRLIEP